jgi:predicted nucleic acid-binding protein
MIDITSLPKTAMVDTGVFLRFLGARPDDPDAPICRAFCEAMLERGYVLYVAAPTLAEIIRQNGEKAPRIKGIVVVPFDDRAAELLGARMPMPRLREALAASSMSLGALKYDAMIMACAARSKTSTLVTLDIVDHLPFAQGLDIAVRRPQDFAAEQLDLPGVLPPAAPEPAAPDILAEAEDAAAPREALPEPAAPATATKQLQLPW